MARFPKFEFLAVGLFRQCARWQLLGFLARLRAEEVELWAVGFGEALVFGGGPGGFLFTCRFRLRAAGVHFEVAEDVLGAVDDRLRQAGEFGDLDAVGFVGRAGEDFAKEDDVVVPLADRDVVVLDGVLGIGEVAEFVVVGGEEGAGLDDVVEVFGDRPGDRETVEGGGAAADFVEESRGCARWRC